MDFGNIKNSFYKDKSIVLNNISIVTKRFYLEKFSQLVKFEAWQVCCKSTNLFIKYIVFCMILFVSVFYIFLFRSFVDLCSWLHLLALSTYSSLTLQPFYWVRLFKTESLFYYLISDMCYFA